MTRKSKITRAPSAIGHARSAITRPRSCTSIRAWPAPATARPSARSYRPGDEAARQYQRSLDIEERLGNQADMAASYSQLGNLEKERGGPSLQPLHGTYERSQSGSASRTPKL